MSRRPYRANPRTDEVIIKGVQDMLNDDVKKVVRPGRWLVLRTTLPWSEASNLSVSHKSKARIGRFPFTLVMSRLRHLPLILARTAINLCRLVFVMLRGFSQKCFIDVGPRLRVVHMYGRAPRFFRNVGESIPIVRKHVWSVASSWSQPDGA